MEFEYDEQKSLSNKNKHGIDFVQAQELWQSRTLTIPTYQGNDPSRELVIGIIDDKHWSAVTTQRGKKTRIISVRRSRKNEEELYEQLRMRD